MITVSLLSILSTATPPCPVVIASPKTANHWSQAEEKLVDELSMLGYAPMRTLLSAREPTSAQNMMRHGQEHLADLVALNNTHSACAAIVITKNVAGATIEIAVAHHADGRLRTHHLDGPFSEAQARIVALSALEVLESLRFELGLRAPKRKPPSSQPKPAMREYTAPAWTIDTGWGAMVSTQSPVQYTTGLTLAVTLRNMFREYSTNNRYGGALRKKTNNYEHSGFGFLGEFYFGLLGSTYKLGKASARLNAGHAQLIAHYFWNFGQVETSAGIGAGVFALMATAETVPTALSAKKRWTATPSLNTVSALRWALPGGLSLRATAGLSLLSARISLLVLEREAGQFGPLLFTGGLTLGYNWLP